MDATRTERLRKRSGPAVEIRSVIANAAKAPSPPARLMHTHHGSIPRNASGCVCGKGGRARQLLNLKRLWVWTCPLTRVRKVCNNKGKQTIRRGQAWGERGLAWLGDRLHMISSAHSRGSRRIIRTI